MKVKDVRGARAVAVRPQASFAEIVDAMRRFKIGAVTVIDADDRPVGVVSEDDLLLKEIGSRARLGGVFGGRRRREERRKVTATTAGEVMTTSVITVTEDTSVRDAARLMHRNRIKQLPVIDAGTGRLIGTVRQNDLLKVFIRPAEEIGQEVGELCERLHLDRRELAVGIEAGVVTLTGQVGFRSQSAQLVAAVRRLEGVVDVEDGVAYRCDDLARVPPLYL
ncbi:CBS domain-containing protein [Streptosporangium sp. NPDC087985]|uniref:CBS domain-containing protein n=1 Tax=Streptosporangium sp. NPDC087985 TaxID=3366196 RepID=UPI00380A7CB3